MVEYGNSRRSSRNFEEGPSCKCIHHWATRQCQTFSLSSKTDIGELDTWRSLSLSLVFRKNKDIQYQHSWTRHELVPSQSFSSRDH